MTEELDEYELFVVKALRTLQLQNDELTKTNLGLVMRIKALEEANLWNVMQGNIEQSPRQDEMVVRLANGNLALNERREAEETEETDD